MKIYKQPVKENDSFHFIIEPEDMLRQEESMYYKAKRAMFATKKTDKENLEEFSYMPSLRFLSQKLNLEGTVYTRTAELKNSMPMFEMINAIRSEKENSRRCVIRIANSLKDYLDNLKDTSCLNIIHVFKNRATLFFRASDMTNELLIDIYLIKEFFLDPVFQEEQYEIEVMASTSQNIMDVRKLIY